MKAVMAQPVWALLAAVVVIAGCPSSPSEDAPPMPAVETPAQQAAVASTPVPQQIEVNEPEPEGTNPNLSPVGTLPPPQPAPTPPSKEVPAENQAISRQLNTEGYRLYNDKQYSEAVSRFEAAAQADPTYALPPYNLACTLCLLRGGEGTCENDAYKGRILSQLEMSILLDPNRLERAKSDGDLACIHDTLRYQKLLGYAVDDPGAVSHLLTTVAWYGPAPGAFGNMSGLNFKADGTLSLWMLEVTDEVKTLHYTGRWLHRGSRIEVTLDKATTGGVTGFTGTLTESGLQTDGGLGPFADIPSECSA